MRERFARSNNFPSSPTAAIDRDPDTIYCLPNFITPLSPRFSTSRYYSLVHLTPFLPATSAHLYRPCELSQRRFFGNDYSEYALSHSAPLLPLASSHVSDL